MEYQDYRVRISYVDQNGNLHHNIIKSTDPAYYKRVSSDVWRKNMEAHYKKHGLTVEALELVETVTLDCVFAGERRNGMTEVERAMKRAFRVAYVVLAFLSIDIGLHVWRLWAIHEAGRML
jgi:hypothetical protein